MISYFTTTIKTANAQPAKNISFADLTKGITGGFKKMVDPVSALTYGSSEYKAAKTNLSYFTPHGVFTTRKNNDLVKLSGLLLQDLDIQENKLLNIENTIDALKKDSSVYYVFKSPGGGIKFFVKYQLDKAPKDIVKNFIKYHNQCAESFEAQYGFKLDYGQGKLSQPCFISYDKTATINKDADFFTLVSIEAIAKIITEAKSYKPTTNKFESAFEMAEYLVSKFGFSWVQGQKNSYLCCLAYCLNRLGVSQINTEGYCQNQYQFYGKTNAIRWYYANRRNDHGTWAFVPYSEFINSKQVERKTPQPAQKVLPFLPVPKREALEIRPFPLAVFPDEYQDIILNICETLDMDENMLSFSIFNAVSGAIGGNVKAKLANSWEATASLFSVIVAPPSTGKSPAIKWAFAPLVSKDGELHEQYQKDYQEYREEIKKLKKGEEKPSEPDEHHLTISDTTLEALMKVLSQNPRGVVIIADELKMFIKAMSRYQNDSQVSAYLSMWSNSWAKNIRKTSKTNRVESPFVNIIGGIQPAILNVLSENDALSNGMFWRFLFCFSGERVPKTWAELCGAKDSKPYEQSYKAYIDKLLNLPHGIVLPMTAEANTKWGEFYDDINKRIGGTPDNNTKEILGKFSIMCGRFALILQLMHYSCNNEHVTQIEAESVEGAVILCEFFILNTMDALNLAEKADVKATDQKKNTGHSSGVDWLELFGPNTELKSKHIIELVMLQKGCASRTARNWMSAELNKVDGKVATYTHLNTEQQ